MAAVRTNLNRRCLLVLSGTSNCLATSLAVELCRRFKAGSVALLIGDSAKDLHAIEKEIAITMLENEVAINCYCHATMDSNGGASLHDRFKSTCDECDLGMFELAVIVHNEGYSATDVLTEPQDPRQWLTYVAENLYTTVTVNQAFLKCTRHLNGLAKVVVNITSSLGIQAAQMHNGNASCKRTRDAYFRAMAAEERTDQVVVLNYSPGLMESHREARDKNNNLLDVNNCDELGQILKMPRVRPAEAALRLINILEETSFCSGHDVDYYDTYKL